MAPPEPVVVRMCLKHGLRRLARRFRNRSPPSRSHNNRRQLTLRRPALGDPGDKLFKQDGQQMHCVLPQRGASRDRPDLVTRQSILSQHECVNEQPSPSDTHARLTATSSDTSPDRRAFTSMLDSIADERLSLHGLGLRRATTTCEGRVPPAQL